PTSRRPSRCPRPARPPRRCNRPRRTARRPPRCGRRARCATASPPTPPRTAGAGPRRRGPSRRRQRPRHRPPAPPTRPTPRRGAGGAGRGARAVRVPVVSGTERLRHPPAPLVTHHHAAQQPRAAGRYVLGHGQRGGDGRRTRVVHAGGVDVVQLEHVGGGTV